MLAMLTKFVRQLFLFVNKQVVRWRTTLLVGEQLYFARQRTTLFVNEQHVCFSINEHVVRQRTIAR